MGAAYLSGKGDSVMKRSNAKRGLFQRGARKAAASLAGLLLLGVGDVSWLSVVGAQAPDVPATAAAAEDQLARTYLNKPAIQLPIHINARVRPMLQEIRLFGKSTPAEAWTLRDKVTGTQNTFTFQAPRDGEYLFTMQTVDRQGKATPADLSKEAPGLAVVVDTQAPQVELASMGTGPEGTLVKFEVRDAHVDTLKTCLLYQTGDRVFRPADLVQGKANVYLIPAQAVFTGMIRATAADLAGNTVSRELNVSQLNAPGALPAVASEPITTPATEKLVIPAEATRPAAKAADPLVLPAPETVTPVTPTPEKMPLADSGLQQTVAVTQKVAPTLPDSPVRKGPEFVDVQPAPMTQTPKTLPVPSSAELRTVPEAPATQTTSRPAAAATTGKQVINSARLSLEYGIEQAGASGVGKVELWVTRDEGKSWTRLCEDPDRKSPIDVELPAEGTYGLSLVVGNGRGFGATPPTAGDAPQMVVEVDTTRPALEINCTRQIVDGAALVSVTWTAKDRGLCADGVELFYATGRQGPWLPIIKGLKAEGQHRWNPPADVGQQVYLRLTARDQAGNVSTSETADPVVLDDLSRPRGQILGISTPATRATAPSGN